MKHPPDSKCEACGGWRFFAWGPDDELVELSAGPTRLGSVILLPAPPGARRCRILADEELDDFRAAAKTLYRLHSETCVR